MVKYLVTGIHGFIGSHFVKEVLDNTTDTITGITRNTNQKHQARLADINNKNRLTILHKDLARDDLSEILQDVDVIVNFAAKTFVDYSIRSPEPFIESNIIGVYKLLEEARKSKENPLFCEISTDEVYGAILEGSYKEDSRLNPTNPYAATKAAGDMLVTSYHNTYGMKTIITRTENNYGMFQSREKVIPTFVRYALNHKPLPVFGDGKHKRMWLRVEDHISAILHLVRNGVSGEIYHVAGEEELENLELANKISKILDKEPNIQFIPDRDARPGHDRRYALNVEKLKSTGWSARYTLETGLPPIVMWYANNQWWWE